MVPLSVAAPVVEGGQSTEAEGRQDQPEGPFNKETQIHFLKKEKNSGGKGPNVVLPTEVLVPVYTLFCVFLHTVVASESDLCEHISDNAGVSTGGNQPCGHAPCILSFADTAKQSPLMRG